MLMQTTLQLLAPQSDETNSLLSFERRSVPIALAPFHDLAERHNAVHAYEYGDFRSGHERYSLPCFVFSSAAARSRDLIRLGIFATLHGDEPEAILALAQFLDELTQRPELADGYRIHLYPMCNPTGFADATRGSRSCTDLNREFWRSSTQPEVFLLEEELLRQNFHGLISLHSDDTSDGVYGFVNGPDLSRDLLLPALLAAEKFLPRNHGQVIDGFAANRGLIERGYSGILSAPPAVQPQPFDLTFETPQRAPMHLQVAAYVAALQCIIAEYRTVMALAQNI